VHVIRHEGGSERGGSAAGDHLTEPIPKLGAIDVVEEDRATLDPPDHDVVYGARCIDARLAGHADPAAGPSGVTTGYGIAFRPATGQARGPAGRVT
jgi:hypothetical protein